MKYSSYFRRLALFGMLSIFACGFVGCENQTEQKDETVPTNLEVAVTEEAPIEAPVSTEKSTTGVSLEVCNEKSLAALIAKHAGKVVLVDYWATWCIPCRKAFPHIVELGKKHAEDGLVLVTVSLDENDEDSKQAVLKFLTDQKSTGENLLSEYGGGEQSYNAFNITGGAIPHGKLFGRDGKFIHSFGFFEPDLPYEPDSIINEISKALEKN